MFLTDLFAQTPAPTENAQGGGLLFGFLDPLTLFMLAAIAVLIFFMFRNNKKRKEQAAELETKMVPGAEVMTNFGLFGRLTDIDEDTNEALIEVSPGVELRIHRQTLARVVEPQVEALDGSHDDLPGDDTDVNPDGTEDRR